MGLKARNVLADCRNALDRLQEETRPKVFHLYWVAGIALARAVGHVLQKVDGEHDDTIKRAVTSAYDAWKADRQASAIFWDFIEQERNQILKEYEVGFLAGPIDVVAGGDLHTLDEHLFCPIADGPFAGEDCRDILEQAIAWWESQLDSIEATVRATGPHA
jgi:hypothetical protein